MQVQELVTIVPWTFIATICNLFIQMYLIKRFLFKPIGEILEKRRQMADEQLSSAAAANEEAQAMKAQYEQDLMGARAKANEIVQNAQRTATLNSEELIKEATRQAAAIKEKAQTDIEQEKRKALNEMKNEIGSMAVDIAGQVLGREVTEADHAKLIEDFIASVGEAT